MDSVVNGIAVANRVGDDARSGFELLPGLAVVYVPVSEGMAAG